MAGKKGMERVISREAASSAGGSLRLARITLQPYKPQTVTAEILSSFQM